MSGVRPWQAFLLVAGAGAIIWAVAADAAFFQGILRPMQHPSGYPLCTEAPNLGGDRNVAAPAGVGAAGPARLALTLGDPATSGLHAWPGVFDAVPTAFDINGDGVQEIIAHSNDTRIYVFNAQTGRVLATLSPNYPPDWYIERVLNDVEAAVLRPGEPVSIVVATHAACVSAWQFVPARSNADTFVFEKTWEHRMNACFWNPGMDAKPTIADLDNDGTMEILVQTEEVGFYALNADGSVRWKHCWAGGNAAPVAADLDTDGDLEAIFASDSGFLSVLDGSSGAPQWTFDAGSDAYGVTPASIPVAPTVAEIDGQPPLDIVFTARHAPANDPTLFPTFHMALFAVHQNRTTWSTELLWMRQPEWAHPLSYTHLVAKDLDGDGRTELLGMDWNTIGHSPGNWELLGFAHVFRLNATGQDAWVHEVDSWWSNKDVALADCDGDGTQELLANGAVDGGDGFWCLSLADGTPGQFLSARPWKIMRGPSLFDLRHDGSTQLVYPVAPDVAMPTRGALLLFDLPGSTATP